jgi:hypothetical protein
MPADQPRKHHYLPQFYLQGFSADGRSVFQIEKTGTRTYPGPVQVHDAAAIRDYHKLDKGGSDNPHVVENELARLEGELSMGLSAVVKSGIRSDDDQAKLIYLVSLMRFRVPAFKKFVEKSHREMVRSGLKTLERNSKLPPIPPGFEDELRVDSLGGPIFNWKLLETMFKLAFDEGLLSMLAEMKADVLRAPDGTSFLTCDQPVAMFNPGAFPHQELGSSLRDPATELTFPLSGQALLRLSWSKGPPEDRSLALLEVDEFNRRTVVMADSYVFSMELSTKTRGFVTRYAHCSAGIDFQVLPVNRGDFHLSRMRPVMSADRYPPNP